MHLDRTFRENYRIAQAKELDQDVPDMYQPGQEVLLASWIAAATTPIWSVESEKIPTSRLMEMHVDAASCSKDWKRVTLRTKLAEMLRRRGVKYAGQATVVWEPGGSYSCDQVRRRVLEVLDRRIRSKAAKAFWRSRFAW